MSSLELHAWHKNTFIITPMSAVHRANPKIHEDIWQLRPPQDQGLSQRLGFQLRKNVLAGKRLVVGSPGSGVGSPAWLNPDTKY